MSCPLAVAQNHLELVCGDQLWADRDEGLLCDSVDETAECAVEGDCREQGTRHSKERVVPRVVTIMTF